MKIQILEMEWGRNFDKLIFQKMESVAPGIRSRRTAKICRIKT